MWCECNINVHECISTDMNEMYMNAMYMNITNDFAMLKICKWLGWSLMSWSGAPILILNEARNSPKECAEGSIQNKLVHEWMENRRSNTVQNQQPAHVVEPGTPSKYYLCEARRLILFESSRPRSFLQPTDVQLLPLPMAKNPTSWFVTSPCFCCWNFVGCYPRVVWV